MHQETYRLLKTVIYKFFVYFPITILLAYIFYRDFLRDLGFAGASVAVGLFLYYLYDWTWHHKSTKPKVCIGITIIWIILLIIGFTIAGIDYSHHEDIIRFK